jgi:hypothetical protein
MKNNLRTIHINSVEWKYAISNGNVRIYEPGTKQIKSTVELKSLPVFNELTDQHEYVSYLHGSYVHGIGPGSVKQYIIDNLI